MNHEINQKQPPIKVLLISWSHVDLAFSNQLSKHYGSQFCVKKFGHHSSWNTDRRSYLKNLVHVLTQLFQLVIIGRGVTVVLFGTNLCRLFFFFRSNTNTHYIYNELPRLKPGLLMYLDRIIFKFARNVYVSTNERKILLAEKGFLVKNVRIIQNVTFNQLDNVNSQIKSGKKLILIGTIDKTRFGEDAVCRLKSIIEQGGTIDVLPSSVVRGTDVSIKDIRILESIPHNKINNFIKQYDFGVLSYAPISLNNYYAAPLKLYEYVNAGLRVLSVFENRGIDAVRKEYPALFIDRISDDTFSVDEYHNQRKEFLNNAILTNTEFVENLIADVKNVFPV